MYRSFDFLAFLRVLVAQLVAQFVHLQAQYLIGLLAEKTVGGGAGPHAWGRSGERFGPANFGLVVGLVLDGSDYGVEVGSGRKTDLLLKVGPFLDAGVVVPQVSLAPKTWARTWGTPSLVIR